MLAGLRGEDTPLQIADLDRAAWDALTNHLAERPHVFCDPERAGDDDAPVSRSAVRTARVPMDVDEVDVVARGPQNGLRPLMLLVLKGVAEIHADFDRRIGLLHRPGNFLMQAA